MDPLKWDETPSSSQAEEEPSKFIEFYLDKDNYKFKKFRHESNIPGGVEDCYVIIDGNRISFHETVYKNFSHLKYRENEELDKNYVSKGIFEQFLSFYYNEKIRFRKEDFFEYFLAAEYLGVERFLIMAEDYFEDQMLSSNNVLSSFFSASRKFPFPLLRLGYLRKKCLSFIGDNYADVFRTQEFLNLPYESENAKNIKDLLICLNKVHIEKEIDLKTVRITEKAGFGKPSFHALMNWVRHNENRLSNLFPLLKNFDFRKFPSEVMQEIAKTPEILQNPTCVDFLVYILAQISETGQTSGPLFDLFSSIYVGMMSQSQNDQQFVYDQCCIQMESTGMSKKEASEAAKEIYKLNLRNLLEHLKKNSEQIAITIASQKLFCLGGIDIQQDVLSSVSKYHPETGWLIRNPMLDPRQDFAAAASSDGKKIYVCSGSSQYGEERPVLSSLHEYDLEGDEWKLLTPKLVNHAPPPEQRSDCSMAYFNGYLYLAGGKTANNVPLRCCYRYCLETSVWTEIEPMIFARSGLKLVALGDYLYAIGGAMYTVERYDPRPGARQWQMANNLRNVNNIFVSGAVVHEKILFTLCAPGGFRAILLGNDIEMDSWVRLPAPNDNLDITIGRGTELVSFNGRLLAVGGCKDGTDLPMREVYEFDLENNRWSFFGQMNTERAFHRALAVNPIE